MRAIRAYLERRGLIAAHVLSLGVVLVSNNLREFRRVPRLRAETWVA